MYFFGGFSFGSIKENGGNGGGVICSDSFKVGVTICGDVVFIKYVIGGPVTFPGVGPVTLLGRGYIQ